MVVNLLKKGLKSAVINALTLALMDAGIGMKDFIVSSTAGKLNNEFISGFVLI
jgi:ribonuclease PH